MYTPTEPSACATATSGTPLNGSAVLGTDPVTGEVTPLVMADSVQTPTDEDGASTYANMRATRAWATAARKTASWS